VQVHYVVRGEWVRRVLALHEQYGDVVRVGPNEISYATQSAWDDIYKTGKNEPQLHRFMPYVDLKKANFNPAHGMFGHTDDVRHQWIRKSLVGPVMNDRGVRERVHWITNNVSNLIHGLRTASTSGSPVNILAWYQAVAADITGSFLTGQDFGTVASGKAHPAHHANHNDLRNIAFGTAFSKNILLKHMVVAKAIRPKYIPYELVAKDRFDETVEKQISTSKPGTEGTLCEALIKDLDTSKGLPREVAFRCFSDFVLGGFDTR
jgi:hypothetical protein